MPAQQRSRRSKEHPSSYKYSSSTVIRSAGSAAGHAQSSQPSLATRLNNDEQLSAGVGSVRSPQQGTVSDIGTLRNADGTMSSLRSTTNTLPSSQRAASGHGKLHKRGSSGSSLPAPPSPMPHSQFATPFATYEEGLTGQSATPPMSSTPKIKPYIRKMSASSKQDDQGRLDLSKSVSDNDRLAGLGIHDFGQRSASDVSFGHAARRGTHARTTSVGSQVSTGSGSYRATQTFVHPMRQTPRPYTPPTGSANASFVNDEEASESDDVIDDDFRLGPYRSKRSMSLSSTPVAAPTPLSKSHTAEDLGIVPKLTNASQTNLSIRSGKSGKSSKSRLRRDTGPSFDLPTSPSSRTSFDRAFSFVSKRSDPDPQTRDERIRAARRKFEEKEALKDRKEEQEQTKRRQSEEAKRAKQRQKSQTRDGAKLTKSNLSPKKGSTEPEQDEEKMVSRSYDEYRPAHEMSLPRQGREAGMSEKTARVHERKSNPQQGWVRFSAWFQTRMLGCGGR